jgi:alginate O-acetyltransferase complex protein AlgI
MVFCSWQFLAFFAVVFAAYWALPWRRPRVWLLLAASFYFYASWNKWLACVIFFSSALDYLLARGIEGLASARGRKALVAVSVAANLGLLCYFKYADFFLESLRQALRACGADASFPALSVVLPVGISFYTFEAINYVVDVYRGKVRAERDPANLLLFILFFPHLVAGPIVRARDFLPQIRRRKRWDWLRAQLGVRFFLTGLFKKWVIADRMAFFADPVFADPGAYRQGALWLAVIAYALQIYGDFSGYTDMAIGVAHLLGYRLAKNFDLPYLATNVSDFWHRWHISLSTWLRDYLFIPLGGSRGGRWQTYRNLLVTMTLGGLWHGASWTFVVWGLLHGLFLVAHRLFAEWCAGRALVRRALASGPGTAARVGLTFLCVSLAWVFFRAPDFGAAATVLRGLFTPHPGLGDPLPAVGLVVTVAALALGHALAHRDLGTRLAAKLPPPALGVVYASFAALCLLLAPPTGKPFIYFPF